MSLAPIALFTYNRLDYLRQTVASLQANTLAQDSDLYIFSDGWKDEDDRCRVEAVRAYLRTVGGFKSIHIEESPCNRRLAPSLIAGISQLLEQSEKLIVFEDDIVCSPFTLAFLNDSLALYQNDEQVGMIHGHVESLDGLPELFFDCKSGCWAWATWKRAWDRVNFDGTQLLEEIRRRKLEKAFDLDGGFRYLKMLRHQIQGKNSSWAVRVYASFFLQGILTLYPGLSYAQHIGFGGGTHFSGQTAARASDGHVRAVRNVAKRIEICANEGAMEKISDYYKSEKRLTPRKIAWEIRRRLYPILRKFQS